jgi:hypothetical protein
MTCGMSKVEQIVHEIVTKHDAGECTADAAMGEIACLAECTESGGDLPAVLYYLSLQWFSGEKPAEKLMEAIKLCITQGEKQQLLLFRMLIIPSRKIRLYSDKLH